MVTDLDDQLSCWGEDHGEKRSGPAGNKIKYLSSKLCNIGKAKASVLPLPVSASAIISLPSRV